MMVFAYVLHHTQDKTTTPILRNGGNDINIQTAPQVPSPNIQTSPHIPPPTHTQELYKPPVPFSHGKSSLIMKRECHAVLASSSNLLRAKHSTASTQHSLTKSHTNASQQKPKANPLRVRHMSTRCVPPPLPKNGYAGRILKLLHSHKKGSKRVSRSQTRR